MEFPHTHHHHPLPTKPPPVARASGIPRVSTSRLPLLRTSANTSPHPQLNAAGLKLRNATSMSVLKSSTSSYLEKHKPKPLPTTTTTTTAIHRAQSRDVLAKTHIDPSASTLDCHGSTLRLSRSPSMTDTPESQDQDPEPRRDPRASLADRTMESIANIPTSPRNRRRSSFFTPLSPMAPASRPASSHSNSSARRRIPSRNHAPGIMAGARVPSLTKPIANTKLRATSPIKSMFNGIARALSPIKPNPKPNGSIQAAGPARRAVSSNSATTNNNKTVKASAPRSTARVPLGGSKTMAARPPKSRPGLDGVFTPPRPSARSTIASVSKATKPPPDAPELVERKARTTSAALREQIRLAKMAHRRESEPSFDLVADSFNQQPTHDDSDLLRRIGEARLEGRLNIAALGLKEIPSEVLSMYEFNAADADVAWGEFVDLTRFTAADNEIAALPDAMFPAADGEDQAPQFGALMTVDLHGNLLSSVPMGFQRLEILTMLNLTRNKFTVAALDTLTHLANLQDLKLGENVLSGPLPASMSRLEKLEVLDLHSNGLTSLPATLSALSRLRILNVSDNALGALPVAALARLPLLLELHAAKNKLSGTLFAGAGADMAALQRLDVSSNALTRLCAAPRLALPSLLELDVSCNAMAAAPDVSACACLTAFRAADNVLSALPPGLTGLMSVRTVDVGGNAIARLDPNIARMEGLVSLRIQANPIREVRFLGLSTEAVKEALRGRIVEARDMDPLVEVMESVVRGGEWVGGGWERG